MQTKNNYFKYGDTELMYLMSKDKRLAEVIERLGTLERKVTPDLFVALMHTIVGQQISVKAQATIWQRVEDTLLVISPQTIADHNADALQQLGLSHRKVGYMQDIAHKVLTGELDLQALYTMTDEQVIAELSALRGIGVWSAEMLMLFSMQRPNIISFGDLAIIRGLRMLHRHREITPKLFAKYQKRYAPYGSVASLYLWAIAGGAIPELTDLQTKKKATEKSIQKTTTTMERTMTQTTKNQESALQQPVLYRDFYHSPYGTLEIQATDDHLCYVQFVSKQKSQLNSTDQTNNHITTQTIKQLQEYFAGQRTLFDVPLSQAGTDFQQKVWQALCDLEYGTTASYKDIAETIKSPKAYRAVGLANNKNRIAIIVPCHRVIGSSGKLIGYAGGLAVKQALLDLEAQRTL